MNENSGKDSQGLSPKKQAWWTPAMFIFFRATAWIAAPIIAALYLGGWLEKKYGEDTHLILISVAVAFFITIAGLIKITLAEFKKMDDQDRDLKNKQ